MPSNRYVGPEYGTTPLPAIAMGKTGEPEELTVDAAVSLETEPTQFNITAGSDQNFTLADGDETQRKLLYMTARTTNDAIVTPASLTGGTTLTFNAVGEYSELRFINGSWAVVASTATLA